jgi:predicted transcriptional regulator
MLERRSQNPGMSYMSAVNVKQAAHQLIDELPDDVSWDEVAYRMEVRASIERGLADADAGRLIPQDEVEKRFGVTR